MSTRNAQIVGEVRFRLGDGPLELVPLGPVEIDPGRGDVTLSWECEDTRHAAAMPSTEFARYVAEGAVKLLPH
jgi:hypothetical protein